MPSTSNTETISQQELTARYQRAAHLEDSAFDETLIARNTTLFPHWVEGSGVFWYQQDTPMATATVWWMLAPRQTKAHLIIRHWPRPWLRQKSLNRISKTVKGDPAELCPQHTAYP